jgi:hypothetical protein
MDRFRKELPQNDLFCGFFCLFLKGTFFVLFPKTTIFGFQTKNMQSSKITFRERAEGKG